MNLTKGTLQLTILLGVVILILVGIVGYLVWKVQKHPTPPTPPTPPQTSLKLLYPKGGEVWKERETYKIKWEAKGVKKVNIEYGDGKSYFVVQNYPADKGEYEWTPQGIVEQYEGFVMKPLAEVQIKISIWDSEHPNLYDKSDDITLISQETADWKVYRNEEYGFEFRYPNEWNNVKQTGDTIMFINSSSQYSGERPADFVVRIYQKPSNLLLEEWVKNLKDIKSEEEITGRIPKGFFEELNGHSFYLIKTTSALSATFIKNAFIEKKGVVVRFAKDLVKREDERIVDLILQTFSWL